MKKTRNLFLVFFFILSLVSSGSQAQSYSLPSPGAKWNIVLDNLTTFCTIKYQYEKDTFMCGYNYAVISNQNQSSCNWWSPILLRSVGNLVYGRIGDCINTEYLLYDFDLNLGDTFIVASNLNDVAIVTNIAYITMLDGSIRKQITLHSAGIFSYEYVWIDGIGDLTSLYYKYNPPDPFLYMLCYEDSSNLIYNNLNWNTCDTSNYVGIVENHFANTSLLIYPNPAHDDFFINCKGPHISNCTVFINDIYGHLVKTYKLISSAEVLNMDVTDLTPGLYVCSIQKEKKYLSILLIKN